jgi:hypothetical protein
MQQTVILNDELVDQALQCSPTKNLNDLLNLALQEYLNHHQVDEFESLLNNTSGIWKQGDGLDYQIKIRENWD